MSAPAWLITGAGGFIGHHLLPSLIQLPSVIDVTLLTRNPDHISIPHSPSIRFALHKGDLTSPHTLDWSGKSFSTVIHMAVFHHATRLNQRELNAIEENNIQGTRHLLESLKNNPPRQFLFLSSIKVTEYLSSTVPHKTSSSDWAYARSKLACEDMIRDWSQTHGVSCGILRPVPVYGPGNQANLGKLFTAVSRGRFLMPGDGHQKKSIVSVKNLVAAMLYTLSLNQMPAQPLTVTDTETHSLRQLCHWIAESAGVKAPRSIGTNELFHSISRIGRSLSPYIPLTGLFRSLEAWLTESQHSSDELIRLGFIHPEDTRTGISRCFQGPS